MNERKISRCFYHLCRKKTEVLRCRYCGECFCEGHLKPKPAGLPIFKSVRPEDLKYMDEWRRIRGHPCLPFTRKWTEKENLRKESETKEYLEALDRLKKTSFDESHRAPSSALPQERPRKGDSPSPKKLNWVYWVLTLLIIFLVCFGIYYYHSSQKGPKCYDGTLYDHCSKSKPFYCYGGDLVKKATICGCPNGYKITFQDCESTNSSITDTQVVKSSGFLESGISSIKNWFRNLKSWLANQVSSLNTSNKAGNLSKFLGDLKDVITVPEEDYPLIESKMLELVNQERAEYGARDLSSNANLNSYARSWSEKMISEDFFEHSNLGFSFSSIAGENIGEVPIASDVIGCGQTYSNDAIAECFVSGWIESQGHHENMINQAFSMSGIGISCDSSKCRATQVFGG